MNLERVQSMAARSVDFLGVSELGEWEIQHAARGVAGFRCIASTTLFYSDM